MLKALYKALNVRPEEENQVLLLLGNGFFMGIFLATYQISAETLFLNRLEEYLKEAILISGLLGVFTTAFFSFLQNRVSFSKLALSNLLLIGAATFTMFILFNIGSEGIQDLLVFILFALIGPILAVCLLGFWGIFGRLFDLRQSKRIIGGIDIGQLSAAILASLTIPFLSELIPDTTSYLPICAVSLLISAFFLYLITSKYDLKKAESSSSSEEVMDTSIKALRKDKYVKLLSVFLIFSMMAFTFVQFSFQNVVAAQYPEEENLREFLAFFTLAILVFGMIMQTFANDKIISEYGLKLTLLVLPVILLVFTLATIVTGTLFGFDPSGGAFIWFFLLVSANRFFNYSLRDSLENPTFKLYFIPLDNRIRFNVQTKVEGVVNESARFIAGAVIFGISFVSFFEDIHYLYFIVALVVGYFIIIGKMHIEYRNKIQLKLEQQQREGITETYSPLELLTTELSGSLNDQRVSKVMFSYKLLEKMEPQVLPNAINTMMVHESEVIRDFAQAKMNEIKGLSVSDKYVITGKERDTSGKNRVSASDLMDLFSSGDIGKSRVSKLAKSDNPEDRQYAAELLANIEERENISFLIELLADINSQVRLTAIKTAQRRYNAEIIRSLISNLKNPRFYVPAAGALTVIGSKALQILDNSFYRTGQDTQTMLRIVQVMGRIGGELARTLLWNKIDYPDKFIVSQVLIALGNAGFKAGITQIPRIKYAIESDIEDIAWNMAAIDEVSDEYFGNDIKKAIEEEIAYDVEHIYMLLSMLYDAQSIELVKENIESGTNEGVTYALELLDVFLSEDLKQRIIPVLDDLAYAERYKKLEVFYPRDPLDQKMVLKFLLNRDFSQTNRWTKTCILYQIGLLEIREFYFDLIANIFNPDPLLREMAAWSLQKIDRSAYLENIQRIPLHEKRQLESVIKPEGELSVLRFDKVLFLKKLDIFDDIIGLVLADLIDITEEISLKNGDTLQLGDNYNDHFYIIFEGAVSMLVDHKIEGNVTKGEFIGEVGYSSSNSVLATTDTILLKMAKDNFYELLSDNISLARKMVEFV
ncbi:MAG: Npt1/Npt2 family nucleotide transporter [Bacteroidota bacterium]